jgi:hypothetical protein
MRSWFLIVVCAITLVSCGDQAREEEQKREVQAEREREALRQKDREAELQLMSDVSSAGPALERRIDDWISKRDGVLFAVERHMAVYVMSGKTPWIIECDRSGIRIILGSWVAQEDGSSYSVIEKSLTKAKLEQEQCLRLGVILGRKLESITRE